MTSWAYPQLRTRHSRAAHDHRSPDKSWLCRAAQEADKDAVVDWSQLAPGTLAAGSVHDVQEYGIVCDLEAHPDLVGLLNTQQVWCQLESCRT